MCKRLYCMHNLKFLIFILFVFFSSSSYAMPGSISLCDSEQYTFLSSATLNGKYISFCAKTEFEPTELQYRFGKPGKIEMSYPQGYAKIKKIDDVSDVDDFEKPLQISQYQNDEIILMRFPFSGGGGMLLSFRYGNYIYHYYSALIKVDMQTHEEIEYLDIYKIGKQKAVAHIRTLNDGVKIR